MRYLTAGESHGKALVGILEGVPAGLCVDVDKINRELARRKAGFGRGGRMSIESDVAEILSGMRGGVTLGSPIAIIIKNNDYQNWEKYMNPQSAIERGRELTAVRPAHADFAGAVKYAFNDARNVLERASARETAIRVAIGAVAKQLLEQLNVFVGSHTLQIGDVVSGYKPQNAFELMEKSDCNDLRCPDAEAYKAMHKLIEKAIENGDTLGGVSGVIISGLRSGYGSYTHYDKKLDYMLFAHLGGLQAVKAVEIGEGIRCAANFGSKAHDSIYSDKGKIYRKTDNAGGIEGGMSNGENITVRAYIKPVPTLRNGLETVDLNTLKPALAAAERSDVCVVPACGVILEALAAFTIAEAVLNTLGGDTMDEVITRYNAKKSIPV